MKRSVGGLKAIVQSVQSPATGYFNNLSNWTMPEIVKAQRLQEAFQRVLDDPAAEEALQHPALKPLLERGRRLNRSGCGPRAAPPPRSRGTTAVEDR